MIHTRCSITVRCIACTVFDVSLLYSRAKIKSEPRVCVFLLLYAAAARPSRPSAARCQFLSLFRSPLLLSLHFDHFYFRFCFLLLFSDYYYIIYFDREKRLYCCTIYKLYFSHRSDKPQFIWMPAKDLLLRRQQKKKTRDLEQVKDATALFSFHGKLYYCWCYLRHLWYSIYLLCASLENLTLCVAYIRKIIYFAHTSGGIISHHWLSCQAMQIEN